MEIDPGDGSGLVQGQVTALGNGEWSVSLPYAYSKADGYNVHLTVTDAQGTQETATSTVEAGDLYAGVLSNLTVAQFVSSNPALSAGDYTATIDWGDGTSSAGTVSAGNGTLTVEGTHNYAIDSLGEKTGAYQMSVTLRDAAGNEQTATHPVIVVRPPVTLQMGNVAMDSNGTVSNQTIATFMEPDAKDSASEFVVTINWGDGTKSSGTLIGDNGLYQVQGGHTYATVGEYIIGVEVDQHWDDLEKVVYIGKPTGHARGLLAVSGVPSDTVIGVPITAQRRDYWINKAMGLLATSTPTTIDDYVNNNVRITAFYASVYKFDPNLGWAGLASYASKGVGDALRQVQLAMKRAPGLQPYGLKPADVGKVLGSGNTAIFKSIGWQLLAYKTGGFAEIEKNKKYIYPTLYRAWTKLAEGKSKNSSDAILEASKLFALHEQRDILQPILDKQPKKFVRLMTLGSGSAKLAGLPGFSTAFGDFSNFKDRWYWVETVLLPHWAIAQRNQSKAISEFINQMIRNAE